MLILLLGEVTKLSSLVIAYFLTTMDSLFSQPGIDQMESCFSLVGLPHHLPRSHILGHCHVAGLLKYDFCFYDQDNS